jgi:cytochrome c-type biogenesis protein CcmE
MNLRAIRWIVGIAVLGTAFALLFRTATEGQLVYYLTVGEFLDKGGQVGREHFRVNGSVVPGTVSRHTHEPGARFEITDGNRRLPVDYRKELPDTFAEGSEAVVEGSLGPDGVFSAHTLLAKCPSKYEPEQADPSLYGPPAADSAGR